MLRFHRRWLALEGYEFPRFQARIERERVARYLDFLETRGEGEERGACEDIGPALPTLPFALEMDAGIVAQLAQLLVVDANRLLHAEQAFTCHGPLRCGDLVSVTSHLEGVSWKPRRQVCFFTKASRFLVSGRLAVSSRSVYAIKAREGETAC
ncbi:hypothetical protein HNO51_18815 [Billgrantia sulfidoxydans]|uniref:FAS1-like dehydratase domain-containing protein n=1 Tax=Billgrantia sulfidoxydans TaxID=2733484 RepID=A0ABX7W8G9_9GAMM|nr:MaoC family dehydratase N-terminal domain-containing protein [Halomonas sulfidoxydans]QTP56551.1 hypothetical protein HNO51_18815 [Halomonas sulfidoxydans]